MEYRVVRQKRKTATIVISDHLEVIVKVPQYITDKQVEKMVNQNEKWILETLRKKKQLIETSDWYYTGQISYLGKYWPISIVSTSLKQYKIDFTDKGFIIVSDGSESLSRKLVEQFYKEQLKKYVTELVYYYAEIVGVKVGRITIRNQTTRWGSCSSRGNLSFNVRILCAPIEMIEYVVLHEVMHLRHFNHSKAFWKDVEVVMPDYKIRMNYFKQFGQNFMV